MVDSNATSRTAGPGPIRRARRETRDDQPHEHRFNKCGHNVMRDSVIIEEQVGVPVRDSLTFGLTSSMNPMRRFRIPRRTLRSACRPRST
jgi:hypothetical protein